MEADNATILIGSNLFNREAGNLWLGHVSPERIFMDKIRGRVGKMSITEDKVSWWIIVGLFRLLNEAYCIILNGQ